MNAYYWKPKHQLKKFGTIFFFGELKKIKIRDLTM